MTVITESIKNHKKPHYGIYRYPWGMYLERAKVYDLLGDKAKAAADRKYSAELKIKDDIVIAEWHKKRKEQSGYYKKKVAEDNKAALERLKKLKEERAKKKKEEEDKKKKKDANE